MLSNNEKRLLYILAVILVVCATGLFFFFRLSVGEKSYFSLNKQVKDIEDLLLAFRLDTKKQEDLSDKIKKIQDDITTEENKFYLQENVNISKFGLDVKEIIESNRLKIESQRTISGRNDTFLEFKFYGKVYNLIQLLKKISQAEKYWRIDEISMKSLKIDGNVDVTMRITYETINLDDY